MLLTEGVDVEYHGDDGVLTAGKVAFIDFERPERNDWLAVAQFAVISGRHNRRPDVVLFVNGLPLVVIELKAPGSGEATLSASFNQLQTYKLQIPALFHTNALLVVSDGITARVGSLSADFERFIPWRTTDGTADSEKGTPELSVLAQGVFEHGRLLDLLRHFTVFGENSAGLVKIVAGYHQYHAVNRAVESTLRAAEEPADYGLPGVAAQPRGDRRAGVIWHTQGSGKSLLMIFYAGRLVKHPAMENPTLVVLTDRNDLDDQLFATFAMCKDLIRQTPVQADSREHLVSLLNRASGGVIFTTLQKFGETAGTLTTRRNVVVIADEAHRSQYGFKAKVDAKTGEISYGFAKYLRDALPGASFIGFTGTPIEEDDANTPAVFGNYIHIYDISRAVVSTEIVDILKAAGLQSPDISILSDEFLAEVQRMEKKNLALEALRKLLGDSIRSRGKTNVVQSRTFSERLEKAVARYHANAITTAEVLQELIQLARDIRAARQRGEEQGLSDEEIAFYDALAENKSAVEIMGDDKLRVIAHELLTNLRKNISVDWTRRESARARMRVLVKRILRKYGYPPDLQDAAVQTVLQQAEALASEWADAEKQTDSGLNHSSGPRSVWSCPESLFCRTFPTDDTASPRNSRHFRRPCGPAVCALPSTGLGSRKIPPKNGLSPAARPRRTPRPGNTRKNGSSGIRHAP